MFTINQNLIDDFADKINEKEKKNNKVTSWSSTTTDAHYPSEKLVKDSLDGKANSTHTHTSLQKTQAIGSNGDLDTITNTGWYSYSTTNSNSISNVPITGQGAVMEVIDDYGDGKYVVQKVCTLSTNNSPVGKYYYRKKYDTVGWSDWKQIIDTDDASTTAPVGNRVNSSATIGSSTSYARADHSHTLTQFKCNGTAGSNGYIKVFQIKINGTYQDSPISFSLMQRGTKQSAVVNIRFANENNNDPTLDNFTFTGSNIGNNGEYYLYKESASTWSFIVRKWDTHDVINIYNMSTTNGSVAITSLNTQVSELPSGCIPASMVKNDLFFKTKNGSTSNYINLFEIRPTGDYQAKPITFEIVRNTKPTPIYVSVRLTNVTLASNDYSVQVFYAWGTSDTTVYIRKEANNVFNVIVLHTANEEISVCNMNNPNQNVKITPLGTVYGTDAPATSGDNQVWYHTYTVGGTTFGTGTNNVVRGNDSRLSDTRNPKSTKISAGSDLNTYTTTGFYYNNANTDCATITPLPQPNKAFFLQVEDWGASNYTKQTLTHYYPVKTYERIRNSGTWTDWYELQHDDGTGGENLLRTEPNNEGTSGVAYTIADETFHNDKVYYRNETSQDTTKYSGWQWAIPRNEFDYGDVFTLSFYAKGTNNAEIRTYFAGESGYISNRRLSSNSDVDNNISSYGDGATRFHLTSNWKKYYVTYQLHTTATTPTQNKSIHIRTFGASADIESYISNVKLERGYYATDYDRHTKDNEPLYFPTEVSMPTTTTSANRRKFIHPPYKFKNIPNWTVEGEIKVTGNSARFELHKTDDTNLKNFIAVGKNGSGYLAYWWGTSSSAESSKTYDASHIAVDTWYPFRISRMGNNVLFMFNNTDNYEVTTTYFNTFEYIEPSIFGYGTNGASVRNLKITPLEPVYPLSPSSSVCTNAQGIITTESKNNHTHSDTQLNWNGGAMVNSASPLDMCLNEELSPNRLAYLDGNNIDVDYSTDGGSTWTSYGASATEKSKLVTTTQTFISGKGATASSNNQLRITIHSGLTSGNASQVYLATRKLMIYYSTGGGSGNKVKIQTNTYGSPDTWTDVKEYNIGGYSGWNSFPLNITFGGFANQTNTTRIKSIRLIFTITSNHNFNVQKIRLYGENCYVAQSDYAKTGHIYTVDINKNTTFPAKIIKEGGTSSQFLMANGDVQNKVTSWSNTPSDTNVASEKLVKDSLDQLGVIDLTSYTNNVSDYDANGISLSVTENNELYVTNGGDYNKPYHTKTFTNNDTYTIQFDIKQPSGTYVGKRFGILIGDPSNVLEISFRDYFVYVYLDGDIIGQISAIAISDYKTIRIHRNLNDWIFDYNNGEKTLTFRTSNDIPNKISYYGFGADEELYVKNVKLYAYSIVNNANNIVDMIYPIGSIYMSVNSTSPQILFGGTWEQIKDTFLLSSGDTYNNGTTGGSADAVVVSHTHTQQSHSHTNSDGNFVTSDVAGANNTRVNYSANGNRMVDGITTTSSIFHHRPATSDTTAINNATGVDGTGKNMPPYLVVNVWKRTA